MEHKLLGGRYELLDIIGEGGMGTVYRAHCQVLDRTVAVKILKPELKNDPSFIEKFKIEGLAAAKINSPNIVNVYDVGQDGDDYYIVMEYVEGYTLRELIDSSGRLALDDAVDIAVVVCDGLMSAHKRGIIHRDIKPQNILITDDGLVKVADFGIARAVNKTTITFGGSILGSVHYISPEQAKGEAVNNTTDLYSLGCVLYEMVTGVLPFDGESPITIALKQIHDDPVSPRAINQEIPEALESIILQAMSKNPQDRFLTAEDMRNQLLKHFYNREPRTAGQHGSGAIIPTASTLKLPNLDKHLTVDSPKSDSASRNKHTKFNTKHIIILLVLAVIGFGAGILSGLGGFFGSSIEVPDITNKTVKDADAILSNRGLTIEVIARQKNEEIAADLIISQDPVGGSKVKEGRQIKVIVSDGSSLIEVPNLVNTDQQQAEAELTTASLAIGVVDDTYDTRYEAGKIISHNPPAKEQVKKGTKVDLLVSKGPEPERIAVPKLIGKDWDSAVALLNENNLVVGIKSEEGSNEYVAGQVIKQSIDPGVMLAEGDTINLTVSKGPGPSVEISSKDYQITLPNEKDSYKVLIRVKDQHGQRDVYEAEHRGNDVVYININHYGSGYCEAFLDGNFYKHFDF